MHEMQAELSKLLAAESHESIDTPMDDRHQPADKSIGDPEPEPPNAARHEAATRDPVKVDAKTGSAGAQHKLASLAAEHTAAAGQSRANTISPSKPFAETASPEAVTSIKTQTYTSTDVRASPANSPAAEGPAQKHTEAGNGTSQPELPMVTSNQPGEGCQSSSTDSGSACTDSAHTPASPAQVSPADSDPSAANLPQCGHDEAALLIESLYETVATNVMPAKSKCRTRNLKPQPLVNACAARCGSGSSRSSKEQSGGLACISNEHANLASARSDFASTSVELDTHSADQHA